MRKFDIGVSKNCIDANSEMVETWDPDNFSRFLPQEWCAWAIPEIALKTLHLVFIYEMELSILNINKYNS